MAENLNFDLSEEHRATESLVRDFAAREVAPHIRENDAAKVFDRTILKGLGELGLLGISVPERYGGAGLDYVSLGLACEELEYVDTSAAGHHVGARRSEFPVAVGVGAAKRRRSAICDRKPRVARSPPTGSRNPMPEAMQWAFGQRPGATGQTTY